jgi:hypothetical protein
VSAVSIGSKSGGGGEVGCKVAAWSNVGIEIAVDDGEKEEDIMFGAEDVCGRRTWNGCGAETGSERAEASCWRESMIWRLEDDSVKAEEVDTADETETDGSEAGAADSAVHTTKLSPGGVKAVATPLAGDAKGNDCENGNNDDDKDADGDAEAATCEIT